jgi:diguanylate cyclase (GGDEF)-like protein
MTQRECIGHDNLSDRVERPLTNADYFGLEHCRRSMKSEVTLQAIVLTRFRHEAVSAARDPTISLRWREPMSLDLQTLYIVILLNSLTLVVIWAAVTYTYRSFKPARFWLAACFLTMTGGAVLALRGDGSWSVPLAMVGNSLLIYGFCLFWVGIRRFYGAAGGLTASAVIAALSTIALMLVIDDSRGRNVVYAVAQSVPLALGAACLLHPSRRQLGDWIAAIAMIVGIVGHATQIGFNFALTEGLVAEAQYRHYMLLMIIFSGVLWNFGFAVMTIDRLRGEVAALAVEDELTGLPNRRRLLERIAAEEARSHRTGRPFALLMIDLDNFKTVNDTYGHGAGDATLRHFGTTVAMQIRKNDLLARLGGDEFCIVLPETDAALAVALASGITEAVRHAGFRWQGRMVPLTVSIGAAAWHAGAAEGDTLTRADSALYSVKAQGRDGFGLDGVPEVKSGRRGLTVVATATP